jgi:mannose/fructose/N-acetylgalactosamine-specific phosphotransferase system component IIC
MRETFKAGFLKTLCGFSCISPRKSYLLGYILKERSSKTVAGIFLFVYVGMVIGNVPGPAVDRTGIALLGTIELFATGQMNTAGAREAIDVPTVALLFGLMVISAQFIYSMSGKSFLSKS